MNRYAIHQLVDYVCWRVKSQGPARDGETGYLDHVAKYVREALVDSEVPMRARQHVAFRASSVLLIYTIVELFLLAALWSEPSAITHGYKWYFVGAAVILFLFGVWQNVITRRIDAAVLHKGLVR